MKIVSLFLLIIFFFSCNGKQNERKPDLQKERADVHSYARPSEAFVKHLDLDLNVDFNQKILTGKAVWSFENPGKADSIYLDTKGLSIAKIASGVNEKPVTYTLGKTDSVLGQQLAVAIDTTASSFTIYYTTSPDAAALQWLNPQQTAGKQQPFLFTQSEPIMARTWIPCQDGPGIRFSYNANVTVPANLMAVMSASGNPVMKNAEGKYIFKQEHPIPSYLMALAVGDIGFKSVDDRTGVYAEPVTLQKAAWEFQDMGKMVAAAENIYGPYRWGRYDLLVLPPSFPYGGMENPMLTFATPTVIAGDRSLVSLVAHELAHSWSGNLVTNATWNETWLNEGFTTYFERRIVEAVYGLEEKQMQEVLGLHDLHDELEELGNDNPDTRLKVDLTGRDPDLGVSNVAYEKGYLFLTKIEDVTGRAAFDSFLNKYFNTHAFQSISTDQFLKYLQDSLIKNNTAWIDSINVDAWVHKPGIPSNLPRIYSVRFQQIDSLISSWKSKRSASDLSGKIKSTNEKLFFLKHLPDDLTIQDMTDLDKNFVFTNSHNAEVQCAWYTLSIKHQYHTADAAIENFLINVGRRKFLMPLYKELAKTPEGKQRAKAIYTKARPNYHSVSFGSVDEVVR